MAGPRFDVAHERALEVSVISRRLILTRRNLLLLALASIGSRWWPVVRAQDGISGDFDLERFMRISRVLTGVEDLADEGSGRRYLGALLGRADGASRLTRLWRTGGFDGPNPPASVADLVASGIYEQAELGQLADLITGNWYSGMFATPDGEQDVATYTGALAWRALGYRPAGPSTCGGAFGHWADAPKV
jgi:hypothetical protein